MATPTGQVNAIGGAPALGGIGNATLNQPVVGMAVTSDLGGYWLVAKDGGIFSFGSAGFFGSEGGQSLASPVTGVITDPAGGGYWLAAENGTVTPFGAAPPAPAPASGTTAAATAFDRIVP